MAFTEVWVHPDVDMRLGPVCGEPPRVEDVLRFEDLPLGSLASRRAVVRWSDGTEGEAARWFSDEVLIGEGDHVNSRFMSSRLEMCDVAGSVGARRAT